MAAVGWREWRVTGGSGGFHFGVMGTGFHFGVMKMV